MNHRLWVSSLTCKDHGTHHSSPYKKKIAEQIENQQLFLDPQKNCFHRVNLIQMTIISTTVGKDPLEEME